MILAARYRYESDIDGKTGLMSDGNAEESLGIVAALFSKFVSHNGGALENESFGADDIYGNFGDDTAAKTNKRSCSASKESSKKRTVRKIGEPVQENNRCSY